MLNSRITTFIICIPNVLEPTGIFPVDARIDGVDDSDDTYGKHKDEMGDEEKDNYEEKEKKD